MPLRKTLYTNAAASSLYNLEPATGMTRLFSSGQCQGKVWAVGFGLQQVREKTDLLKSIGPCKLLAHSLAMPGSTRRSARELPGATIPKPFSGQKPNNALTEPQEVQIYCLMLTQLCKSQHTFLLYLPSHFQTTGFSCYDPQGVLLCADKMFLLPGPLGWC